MEEVILYPQEAHYLRGNKSICLPKRLLFLATDTIVEDSSSLLEQLHRFSHGWSQYIVRKGPDYAGCGNLPTDFSSSQVMLDYVESLAKPKSPLHVICLDPVMDVGASGFIPFFTDRGYELDFYYSGGSTFILVIHQETKRIKVFGYRNFLPQPIDEVAKMVGYRSLSELKADYKAVSMPISPFLGTVMKAGILQYLKFVWKHDLGGFAPSISGQSMRAFRHRFLQGKKILIYHGINVNGVERDGYFGARTECYRIGEQPKVPYVQVDINGMYAYIMANRDYPVRLVNPRHGVTPDKMEKLLERYLVMGKCWIKTDVPFYPVRREKNLIFPVGRFQTTLCTESIRDALRRKAFLMGDPVWVWEKENLFRDYVRFFHFLRMQYKDGENDVMAFVAKRFLNSLYGKFGELRDVEIDSAPHDSPEFFRQGYYNDATQELGFEEILFNRWRICEGKREAPQSFPAIAAHVTDYARCYLWDFICQIGLENVLYVDTDSLIFERRFLDKLEPFLHPMNLGCLRVVGESDHLVLHGPKDYEFGDSVKTKGVRSGAPESSAGVFTQHQYPSFIGLLRDRCYEKVPVRTIRKTLTRKYDKGNVSSDGKVTPYVLSEF